MSKKLIILFSISIIVLIAICYLPIFLFTTATNPKDFEQKEWSEDVAHRHRMVDSLKPQLVGKTELEVIKLLGKPTEYTPNKKCSYYIGGVYVDDMFLNIYFENGKVKYMEKISVG